MFTVQFGLQGNDEHTNPIVPQGRQPIARGASPWEREQLPQKPISPEGAAALPAVRASMGEEAYLDPGTYVPGYWLPPLRDYG